MEPKNSCQTIITKTGWLSEMAEDLLYISQVDSKHGIGFSIVKTVVDLRKGTIMVDCEQGTCF